MVDFDLNPVIEDEITNFKELKSKKETSVDDDNVTVLDQINNGVKLTSDLATEGIRMFLQSFIKE